MKIQWKFADGTTSEVEVNEEIGNNYITASRREESNLARKERYKIATVINRESDKALEDIDKRLEELQTEVLKLATSNADYDKVGDEIHRLRDQKQKLLLESDELKKRMADMSIFLKKQSTALSKYDEQLVRRLVEKLTIYEDKF